METTLIILLVLMTSASLGIIFQLRSKLKKALEFNDKLEARMYDKNQDLMGKARYSELGMMVAGITHEMNNLMTIIQARVTQIMRNYKNPDKEKEIALGLNQITYTVERMSRTINGIRQLVHIKEDEVDDTISLVEILDDVQLFCGQRIKNHGIEFRINCPEGLIVQGQKALLKQAFINLVNNSFDAIDNLHDKWIEISVIDGKDDMEIFFKDSGFGIPGQITDKMMDPYYTTKASQGTGLGLSFVKAVAEQHGGTLQYMDNVFNTTFRLTLPKPSKEIEPILPHYFDQSPSDIYPLS